MRRLVVVLGLLFSALPFEAHALTSPGNITLASTSDTGVRGNRFSASPALSADGTKVAFWSSATNLDPFDTDAVSDIYVKTLPSGDIGLASTSEMGVKGDAGSDSPSLSADGTKVAFQSGARNLDPTDTDAIPDVYVKDLVSGEIVVASRSDANVKGNDSSYAPALSADGTKVAFTSYSTNLDVGDTDSFRDIYVKDLTTGDITLVSTSDTGVKGDLESDDASISSDARRIAFESDATNLDATDTDTVRDLYVKDVVTGNITLVSTSDAGVKGDRGSFDPSLSGGGSTLAFRSDARNLDPADSSFFGDSDVYVKVVATGALSLASTSDAGAKGNGDSFDPAMSVDGSKVAFRSAATNLDLVDADPDRAHDIFVKDLGNGDVSVASTSDLGLKANDTSSDPTLSANGTIVAFSSTATNLDPADTDMEDDIYVKEVATADLSVAKTESAEPAPTGRQLMYTLTVNNLGPHSAAGVIAKDTLPPSVTFVSASPSQGSCTQGGNDVRCNLGTILAGSTARVDIVVTPSSVGTITNRAGVSAAAFDPALGNNDDSENTRVCRRTSRRSSIPC